MKKFTIIILLFIAGCEPNSKKERIVLTQVHSIEYLTEKKLELYEVNIQLYTILDSIIETVTNCPEYFNQQLGFELLFYERDAGNSFIITNILDLNFQNYLNYDGIFYYKGYQFGIVNPINNSLLKKLNRKVTLYSISEEKFKSVYIDNSKNSYWIYSYDNDAFKCIEINHCGKLFNKVLSKPY